MNDDIFLQEEQYNNFINNGIINKNLITISYGHSAFNCGNSKNTSSLIPIIDVDNLEFVSKSWTNKTKILIMSFEDQPIDKMELIAANLYNRCNKMYKIIILRDILNCFASRFQAICDRNNKYWSQNIDPVFVNLVKDGGFFKTNIDTLQLWKSHYYLSKEEQYVVFNYNLFLCQDDYKKLVFNNLDLPFNELLYKSKSSFGHGSSYTHSDETKEILDLFSRFYNGYVCNSRINNILIKKLNINYMQLLNYILNDQELLNIIKTDFLIDIQKKNNSTNKLDRFNKNNEYIITICNENNPILISIPELGYMYYNKYLKYKKKYLELKNNNLF
jgi:hypothetical protein